MTAREEVPDVDQLARSMLRLYGAHDHHDEHDHNGSGGGPGAGPRRQISRPTRTVPQQPSVTASGT